MWGSGGSRGSGGRGSKRYIGQCVSVIICYQLSDIKSDRVLHHIRASKPQPFSQTLCGFHRVSMITAGFIWLPV